MDRALGPLYPTSVNICPEAWTVVLSSVGCLSRFQVSEEPDPQEPPGSQEPAGSQGDPGPARPAGTAIGETKVLSLRGPRLRRCAAGPREPPAPPAGPSAPASRVRVDVVTEPLCPKLHALPTARAAWPCRWLGGAQGPSILAALGLALWEAGLGVRNGC